MGSTSVVGEEEGWKFTSVCGLQAIEQDDNQEQVSPSEKRWSDGSITWGVSVLKDWSTVRVPPDLGETGWRIEDSL